MIFQQDKNHIIAVFLKIKFMCNSFTNTQKHITNKHTDTNQLSNIQTHNEKP